MSNQAIGTVRPIDILLVENSLGDVRLLRKLFRDASITNALHVVSDTASALEFLCQRGDYTDAPRPDILLLDWHLTTSNEHDVLGYLTTHPRLSQIAVIILTGTSTKKDQIKTTPHQANGVLVKPITKGELIDTVCSINGFGLSIVHQSTTSHNE